MHLHAGELHPNLVSLIRLAHSRGLKSFQLNCGSQPGSQKRVWAGCAIAEDSGKNAASGNNLQVSGCKPWHACDVTLIVHERIFEALQGVSQ
jgi:hypothetical protein